MTINPEAIARTAQMDQYRAEASHRLNDLIDGYRAAIDNPHHHTLAEAAHIQIVTAIYELVDPDQTLPPRRSGCLLNACELLATAIERLARR